MRDHEPPPDKKLPEQAQNLIGRVEVRAARILRARGGGGSPAWRAMALVGLIGWTVVLPMLIGVLVGAWIDRTWPSRYSWTLMLLVGGLGFGCVTAWTRIREEQDR